MLKPIASAVALVLLASVHVPGREATQGSVIVVDSEADLPDTNPFDGVCATSVGTCTLRAAVQTMNMRAVAGTVVLPAGVYQLAIPHDPDNESDANGDLEIVGGDIVGAGAKSTIIDGGGLDRIFELGDANIHISGVTLRNGFAQDGGAISNVFEGLLYLTDVEVTGNTATRNGGGIHTLVGHTYLTNVTLGGEHGGGSRRRGDDPQGRPERHDQWKRRAVWRRRFRSVGRGQCDDCR